MSIFFNPRLKSNRINKAKLMERKVKVVKNQKLEKIII